MPDLITVTFARGDASSSARSALATERALRREICPVLFRLLTVRVATAAFSPIIAQPANHEYGGPHRGVQPRSNLSMWTRVSASSNHR